ncbi:protein 5NUC-like [Planococcus citri]|uniref:protein 5NUC-like n=1 Tax=Planococcus citri TaxID=170843 RepID=UPI0031F78A3F
MNLCVAYLLFLAAHIYLAVEAVDSDKPAGSGNPDKPVEPVVDFRLQLLHNNDLHARFEEMDEDTGACPDEDAKQKKCYGGFARMKKAADVARNEAGEIPTIFLNAGDNFQGSPYYSRFKYKAIFPMVDMLDMNATSPGNHEFDDGIDDFVEYLKQLKTPVVCANIDKVKEPKFNVPDKLLKSIIIPLSYGEKQRKIGVVGYLTPEAKRPRLATLELADEIAEIQREAQRLNEEGVKIIIALGHAGYERDLEIAQQVKEISMVVGGDSHTLLYTPPERKPGETDEAYEKRKQPPSVEKVTGLYPTIVEQDGTGKKVPVVQAYGLSKYLGKLMVDFDAEGNVITAKGNPQLLDSSVEKDEKVQAAVSEWTKRVEEEIKDFREIKGRTRTTLSKANFEEGEFESSLANLITDAFVDWGVQLAHEQKYPHGWTQTPISFYPNGGVRIRINHKRASGALTREDLLYVMPFQNKMFRLIVKGSLLRRFLEKSIHDYDAEDTTLNMKHFIQFSGLRVMFDLTKPKNHRVASVAALCGDCDIPRYEPLEDSKTYGIITQRTESNKFKYMEQSPGELIENTELGEYKDIDVVLDYIKRHKIITPKLDQRVTITGFRSKHSDTSMPEAEDSLETTTDLNPKRIKT